MGVDKEGGRKDWEGLFEEFLWHEVQHFKQNEVIATKIAMDAILSQETIKVLRRKFEKVPSAMNDDK